MFKKEKIIYFGAWAHLNPLHNELFRNKDIIFVDSQPFTENDIGEVYNEKFYRPKFIERIDKKYAKFGFKKEKEIACIPLIERKKPDNLQVPYLNPTLLIYKDDNNVYSKYYVSSGFPDGLSKLLIYELQQANELIISGYAPSSNILKYMKSPLTVYCYSRSVYNYSEEESLERRGPTIIDILYDNYSIAKSLYLIDYRNENEINEYPNIDLLWKECAEIDENDFEESDSS